MIDSRSAQSEAGPLQGIMLSFLLVSLGAVLMVGWYDGLAQGYGVDFASDEYDEFNVFNETSSEVEGLRETLKDVSGPVDFITALISGGYKVLLSFLTSIPKIGFGLLVSAQEATDMPAEVVNIGITMLLVVVIFAVLALIMKVRA